MRAIAVACLLAALGPGQAAPALAQHATPSRLAIDSVASVDSTVDGNGHAVNGVIADALVSVDLGRGVEGLVRPFVQRLANTGEWNRQIWIADLRWEHQGPVAFRVDAGYIPSPIGLANLTLRPHLNPTIAQPASLFTAPPLLEPRGTRFNLLGAIYPLGAQVTASAVHWDVRTAIIDSSPLRSRRVFADTNPPRFVNVVVGAGITPFVGFRVGASLATGGWQRANETPTVVADRNARVVTVESELAFRHTALAGEWTRDLIDTRFGTKDVSGWYVQGQQTLSPRWFVAGRVERMASDFTLGVERESRFTATEQTIGLRLTSDVTLRVSHRAVERFGTSGYGHTGAVSLVWFRRWM